MYLTSCWFIFPCFLIFFCHLPKSSSDACWGHYIKIKYLGVQCRSFQSRARWQSKESLNHDDHVFVAPLWVPAVAASGTLIFKIYLNILFSVSKGGQEHGLLVWGFRYKQELCARRKDKQTQQWGWFAHTQTKIVLCSSLMRILIILQAYDIRQADKTAPTQCSTEMVSIFSRCSHQALMSTQGSSTAICPMIPISMEIQPHTQQTDKSFLTWHNAQYARTFAIFGFQN